MAGSGSVGAKLADLVEAHQDTLVDRALAILVSETRTAYRDLPLEQLRPAVELGYRHILRDLAEDVPRHFGEYLASAAHRRALQGFQIEDMQEGIRISYRNLRDLFHETLSDPAELVAALERVHAILAVSSEMLFAGFIRAKEAILTEQFAIVKELSSPILPIYAGVLVLPLVGAMDAERGADVMEALLQGITSAGAEVVLIDVTGVLTMGAESVRGLTQAASAARLLGAQVIVVGISPTVAQTMVEQGADLGGIVTRSTLQAGLELALQQRGLSIERRRR